MISDEAYQELAEVVGSENASREPAILDGYAFQSYANDMDTYPWVPRPAAVVLPGSTGEVQAVVGVCGANGLKFKAFSTGWGVYCGPGCDGVVQVDLRRMNRILEIDEKNMYAVVEPYAICAQVQAEAMKRGLTLHIIGAGCGTSPLASVTSMDGTGATGLTTSYNARNMLGLEWVLPDGELLRLGTLGSGLGWFSGDGPGPSLRGIVRGLFGARSALGIYTACAIKLFPYNGPAQPKVKGTFQDISAEIPNNWKTYNCVFPSFEAYADAAYDIADAEIGYMLCKHSIGATLGAMAPRLLRKMARTKNLLDMANFAEHMFQFMIGAYSRGELEYQEKVLKEIVLRNNGILMDMADIPGLHDMLWWSFLRGSIYPSIFRMGGTFNTSFGSVEAFDNAVNQSRTGAELKRRYIDRGDMLEDLADNVWGGVYEGHFGHQEELFCYDGRNPQHLEGAGKYVEEASLLMKEKCYGVGLGALMLPVEERDRIFGPNAFNFHLWQRRIKDVFDPADVGDGSFYVSRGDDS